MDFQWYTSLTTDSNEVDVSSFFLDAVNGSGTSPENVAMTTGAGNDIVQYLLDSSGTFSTEESVFSSPDQKATELFEHNFVSGSSPGREESITGTLQMAVTTTDFVPNDPIIAPQETAATQQWVTSVIPSVNRTPQGSNGNTRRPIGKKNREPIFVTESPENIYKKKRQKNTGKEKEGGSPAGPSSSSSNDEGELEDIAEGTYSANLKQMTSKERRQLRNKISARNFRVRRKEYLGQLETQIQEQETRIKQLENENRQLRKSNEELMLKLQQWEQTSNPVVVTPPTTYERQFPEPPSIVPFDLDILPCLDFGNAGRNTFHLSYAVMPDWDFARLLSEAANDESGEQLLRLYPLFAPAIMSIVLRHTFMLHYEAFLMSSFPYNNTSLVVSKNSRAKSKFMDSTHLDDFARTLDNMASLAEADMAEKRHKPSDHVCREETEAKHAENTDSHQPLEDDDEITTEQVYELLLTRCYKYYTFMRVRGVSHDEIIERARKCYKAERQRQREKALGIKSASHRLRAMAAFVSVAGNLLRHPDRTSQVWKVLSDSRTVNPPAQIMDGPSSSSHRSILFKQPLRALRMSRH
ncbi:hypothetical protein EC973_005434 [Apophysomyces ossiformis]|uniref:BZIP domain-containing protein n=1 Tax=Apophysomyces ossiformis TaxID=679940 RepID=A0A8H7BRL8_9FUNG|nr:hypothetical protein EC973_005434 [Apophysomyces ossiformis]